MTEMVCRTVVAAVLLAGLAGPLAAQQDTKQKDEPRNWETARLIVKGKGYLVHALPRDLLPASDAVGGPFGGLVGGQDRGLVLLHVSTTTGDMKVLLTTGFWRLEGREQVNVPRVRNGMARVVGTTADAARLYVAWWQADEVQTTGFMPRPWRPAFGKGRYRLLVFRLSDGTKVQDLDLKKESGPRALPAETVGRGPLQVHADGVSAFGTRYRLAGGRLVPAADRQGDRNPEPK